MTPCDNNYNVPTIMAQGDYSDTLRMMTQNYTVHNVTMTVQYNVTIKTKCVLFVRCDNYVKENYHGIVRKGRLDDNKT